MPSSAKSKPGRLMLASSTRSPIFQPPSYYAAANGLPYGRTRTPLPENSTMPTPNIDQRPEAVHYERFMPISYLPDPSPSDSSLEFRPMEIHATTGSSTTKSTNRGKRQSQIAGLPQIEAQLLPSLRDTINKMTRPSRLAPPVTVVAEASTSRRASRHQRYEHGAHYPDFSTNAHDRNIPSRPRRVLSPKTFDPPDNDSPKMIVTPVLPPVNPEQKPSSCESSQDTPRPDPVSNEKTSLATPTLRSVKSLLTRKLSINSPNTISSPEPRKKVLLKDTLKAPKSSTGSSPRVQQQRAGTLCRTPPAVSPSDLASPPKRPSALRQPSQHQKSNIPRFRARFALDVAQQASSDSSDIERQYELARVQQRRLTVINTNDPVSSSSESTREHYPTPALPRPGVGLGLDCHFPSPRSPCPEVGSYSESDRSIHSSVTSSSSSNSQYSTSSEDQESSCETKVLEEKQQKQELPRPLEENRSHCHVTRSNEGSRYVVGRDASYSTPRELEAFRKNSNFTHTSGSVRSPASLTRPQPSGNILAKSNELTLKERYPHVMPGSLPIPSSGVLQATRRDESTKRVKGKIGSAIARLARRSLMVAAREREAFGLRPSDSEEYHQQFENIRQNPPCEDHLLENSAARVSGISEDTFSRGASHLFQAIEAKQQPPSRYSTIRSDGNVIREPRRSNEFQSQDHSSTRESSFSSSSQFNDGTLEDLSHLRAILDQLSRTEEDFVATMRQCIQLYVLPLRINGSKAWISGVPPQVSRFLDWFEDILHLHERVLVLLHEPRQKMLKEIIQFLPKFEIYQPYLVCVGDFTQRLRHLTHKGDDFGHFVSLQDKQIRKSGWSLLKYINEPEKRLQKYLELFSALHMSTVPRDYLFLTIFSLLRTLELITDTMKTVKQEEERYRYLCSLLNRFQGSHSLNCLADRKRTLLWHGSVMLHMDNKTTRHDHDVSQAFKTQRLSKAITTWDSHRSAGPSYDQDLRESFTSLDTASDYSGSTSASQDDSSLSLRDPSNASVLVFAAILSDVVLFGECSPGSGDSYKLIEEIGMIRVFSIQNTDSSSAFLQVIPIDSVDTAPNEVGLIKGLFLSLSPSSTNVSSDQELDQDMFTALRSSAEHTRQIWCRPWKMGKAMDEDDTLRTLSSLVGSGLPLPKSPSGCLLEIGPDADDTLSQEREERGWWSLRFHQVMSAKRRMNLDTV